VTRRRRNSSSLLACIEPVARLCFGLYLNHCADPKARAAMARVCAFTGRRTKSGRQYTLRGRPKYLGGVGTKITGKTKREFKPNLQKVSAVMQDGSVKRVQASTKAIRKGLVAKPLKRKYAYTRAQKQG